MTSTDAAVNHLRDIPGWFPWIDQRLFEHFLSEDAVVPRGNLVELGAYLGKSAVLIGRFKHPDETFTVCDLFGAPAGDTPNQVENSRSYSELTREKFERNYRALHEQLPVIVQDFSSTIVDHVPPASVRFVHVDASHLYAHVATDVESARTLLLPDAIACFDDFRSPHTPGVAAAVWEAVFDKGLRPVCITDRKFYATFGDAAKHQERLRAWLTDEARADRFRLETQQIAGAPVVRISNSRRSGHFAGMADADGSAPLHPALEDLSRQVGKLTDRVARMDSRLARLQREVSGARPSLAERALRRLRRRRS